MSSAVFSVERSSFAPGESWARALLRFLLVALVVPTHDVLTAVWEAGAPWSDVAAVLLATSVLLWLARRPEDSPFSVFRYPLLAVAAVSLISAGVNQVPWIQAAEGLRAMLPWMVAGLASAAVFKPAEVRGVLGLMVMAGTLVAAYGILSFITFRLVDGPRGLPNGPLTLWESVMLYPYYCGAYPVPGGWRLVSTFMNDNYLGVWLVMLVAVALGLTLTESRPRLRIAGYVAIGIMLAAFTWTYSRSAVLALGVAVVVLTCKVSRRAPLLFLPVLLAAPLYLAPVDVYRFQHLQETSGGRIASVQQTATGLTERFWLGYGPGTRGLADLNYAKIGFETGVLGLATFGWLLFVGVRPALRRDHASMKVATQRGALFAAAAGMAAAGLGGEVWETPQLAFYFWMLAGLISVLSTSRPQRGGEQTDGWNGHS